MLHMQPLNEVGQFESSCRAAIGVRQRCADGPVRLQLL